MPLVVVLDASVLFPVSLCDTLMRLAEKDLYQPLWSEKILDEVQRSVTRRGYSAQIGRRTAAMMDRFPDAMTPPSVDTERKVTLPDPDDRHVVATAIVGDATMIVTHNLRDFPKSQLPPKIASKHPDAFLRILMQEEPSSVIQCIQEQAADTGRYGKSQLTVPYILRSLELAGVPEFAAAVRERLAGA